MRKFPSISEHHPFAVSSRITGVSSSLSSQQAPQFRYNVYRIDASGSNAIYKTCTKYSDTGGKDHRWSWCHKLSHVAPPLFFLVKYTQSYHKCNYCIEIQQSSNVKYNLVSLCSFAVNGASSSCQF